MPEPTSGTEDPVSGSMQPEMSANSGCARYKMMTPARLPITRSPCLTIPSGFSPSALLESPVLLTNMKAEPSPTTGTFAMPLIMNDGGLPSLGSPKDSSKGFSNENSTYFEFRPHIRLSSHSGLSTLAPLVSLGLNSKQHEFTGLKQNLCEINGPSVSQVVKTENVVQSSSELTRSVRTSGSPVEVALTASMLSEDTSYDLQQPKDPNCGMQTSQSDHNGSISLNAAEKSTEDGYNWRKYGQKHVKGSEFPRSYYKCTHPNCQMKKQLERSHDGQIADIIYKGRHDHPKPQPSRRAGAIFTGQEEEKQDVFSSLANAGGEMFPNAHDHTSHVSPKCNSELSPISASDDEAEVGAGQSGVNVDEIADDDDSESKRRKLEVTTIDANSIAKNNREPRVVVQTVSEVDILDDGYRWRKYGQKVVKGNPNPRSYYKCTNSGCSVRKHVERASHDPKAVITTYEGKHNHDVPAAKTSINRESSPSPLMPSDGTNPHIPRSYIPHPYSYRQPEEGANGISLQLGLTCDEVMMASKLYGRSSTSSSNNNNNNVVVFGSIEDDKEGFCFNSQIVNPSSTSSNLYYPRADSLIMGP